MNQKASDVFDAFREHGVLTAMIGDDTDLTGIASVETCGPGDLVFVDRATSVPLVLSNRPAAVVTSDKLQYAFDGHDRVTVLVAPNVKLAQALLRQEYADRDLRNTEWPDIHPSAVIHESASLGEGTVVGPAVVVCADVRIGKGCAIMAGTVIERGAVLGNDVVIHPNVTVGYECEIGDDAILHSGSVIGSEGYSFAQDASGRSHRLPQTGKVVVEERVRVGANNCIDRAAFGETRIGAGTKMDNLCHVAHNVTLGRDCLLTAGFIIAGSVSIGDRLLATGTSWVSDHLTLCDDVALVHRAGVTRDIVHPGAYAGTPAVPLSDHMKTVALTRKLGDTRSRLITLEKEVEALRKQVGNGPSGPDRLAQEVQIVSSGFPNVYEDDERAGSYAELEFPGTYWLAYRDIPALLDAHVRGTRALDFGCGTGRSTRFLRDLGFEVVGVDVAESMLARAREKDPDGDYRLVPDGDYRLVPDDELPGLEPCSFDVILSAFTFDNIPEMENKVILLTALGRLLADDGRMVNLVSSPEIYLNEWASFSTKDFQENRDARSGDTVRIVMLDVEDRRPVEDVLCTGEAYSAAYEQAGLETIAIHRPMGREEEPFDWVRETEISPWVIYVLGRTLARQQSPQPEHSKCGS